MKVEEKTAGLYIHVPFCKRKCLYCDFYSVGQKYISTYFMEGLRKEFLLRRKEIEDASVITLYIGGGTPSLLDPEYIHEIRTWIDKPVLEFTLEINPDDVDEIKAREWKEAGVNRLSMGVQSLDNSELKAIGRRHDASQAVKAYEILNGWFDNISLDLMFGLPGQTLKSLERSVETIVKLKPQHISAYSLMYEERTAITRMRDSGMVEEVPEEDSVRMFRLINDMLARSGYERYEISNYSLPGFRSHHNSNYWKGIPYLGLGPSAHSYDGRRMRRYNPADLKGYLSHYNEKDNSGIDPFFEEEILSDDELREEMIMTRLRTSEGLDISEFEKRFGPDAEKRILSQARRFVSKGDLEIIDNHLVLSDSGIMISDDIISSLF